MELTICEINKEFEKIFNESPAVLAESSVFVTQPDMSETHIRTTDIAQILIQNAGRWCDRYASDFLITWDSVRRALSKHMSAQNELSTETFTLAYRRHGVDHDVFVYNNMKNTIPLSYYYDVILAVQIRDYKNNNDDYKNVTITLKDITQTVCAKQHLLANSIC